jgi:hypothetical protein
MRYLLLLLVLGCGPASTDLSPVDSGDEGTDEWDGRYDPDHLTVVEGSLEEDEWYDLCHETNLFFDLLMGPDCFEEPLGRTFLWHPGDVTVDGETLGEVGFRKKGLIGSMSWSRPSLKVDSDRFVDGQEFADGTEHFTLNNNNQDMSRVHTCMAYTVFRAAGVPAPRCSFATVAINGEDLGVYSNVQPIKKAFLRENFGTDDGDLFEGTASDFSDEWVVTFDVKTDYSTLEPLEELVAALELPDDELIEGLEAILDFDGFMTFWAVEGLIGHWDGYAQGSNNFYIYHDSGDGLLHFIPWGADAVFEAPSVDSLFTGSLLVMRLWNHPETQARYLAESQRLLDEVWDEGWLHDEVDRMEALFEPHLLEPQRTADFIDDVRAFIDARRSTVQGVVDSPPVRPSYDKPKGCLEPIGSLSASFATEWDTMDDPSVFFNFPSTLEGSMYGEPLFNSMVGAQAGIGEDGERYIAIVGVDDAFQNLTYAALIIPDDLVAGTYAVDIAAVMGVVFNLDLTDPNAQPEGFVFMGGELVLDEMSYTSGGAISGELNAVLLPNIFE